MGLIKFLPRSIFFRYRVSISVFCSFKQYFLVGKKGMVALTMVTTFPAFDEMSATGGGDTG